jgi:hypothetical protein
VTPGDSHRGCRLGVADQLDDRVGGGLGVTRGIQPAARAIDDLLRPRGVGSDRRAPGRQRLQHRQAEGLAWSTVQQARRAGEIRSGVGGGACELHAAGEIG